MFTKLVEIPDKYRSVVPSDFVSDAQRIMKLMDPPGPMVECRPVIDEAGRYVMPSWVIHYEVGNQPCTFSFCAPFRYVRNLLRESPDLSCLLAAVVAGGAPAPSRELLVSRAGQYQSRVIQDKIEEDKQSPLDISEIV